MIDRVDTASTAGAGSRAAAGSASRSLAASVARRESSAASLLVTRDSGEQGDDPRRDRHAAVFPGHPGAVAAARTRSGSRSPTRSGRSAKRPLLRLDLASRRPRAAGRSRRAGDVPPARRRPAARLGGARRQRRVGAQPDRRPRLAHRRSTGEQASTRERSAPSFKRRRRLGPADRARGRSFGWTRPRPWRPMPLRSSSRLDGALGLAVGARVRLGHCGRPGRAVADRPRNPQDHRASDAAGPRSGSWSRAAASGSPTASEAPSLGIEPQTLRPIGDPIDVGTEPSSLAAAGDYLFVGRASLGTVTRIGVRAGRKVGAPIRFVKPTKHASAFALAPSGTSVWVSTFASSTLTRISSTGVGTPTPAATVSSDHQSASGAEEAPSRCHGGRVDCDSARKRRVRDR